MLMHKKFLSRSCVWIIIGFAVLPFACSKKSPTEPDLSENRGLALTEKDEQVSSLDRIVWSADGQEIFYVSRQTGGSSYRIRAVKVADKSKRTIDGGNNSYWLHELSPDGKYLYYAAETGRPELFRVLTNGQNAERLIGDVAIVETGAAVALSPDNIEIAYAGLHDQVDSLFIFDTVKKSKRFYVAGLPVIFSPDGNQLLFRKRFPSYDSLYTISLDNGSIQFLSGAPTADQFKIWMLQWDSQGIRALLSGSAGTVIRNMTTSSTTPVFSGNPAGAFIAWSTAGNKFAYWAWQCLKASSLLSCGIAEYSINLIDLSANQTVRVAYGNNADGGSGGLYAIAFSPDSKRIAFVFSDQIYLKEL